MHECAVCFPDTSPYLVGIFTEGQSIDTQAPAIVFLNAGLLPRTGPNRLYVRLARENARLGFSAFRFDQGGIGDSHPRTDGLSLRDAAVRDAQEALDFLAAARGVSSFILVGLCSGADLAFRVSTIDRRVVGAVFIDGLPYRTIRSRINHQLLRVHRRFANGGWRKLLSSSGPILRNLNYLTGFIKGSRVAARNQSGRSTWPNGRDVPPLAEAEAGLRRMAARGVKILTIYTEGRGYNYRKQFAHLFPRVPKDAVQVEYFEGADHLFSLTANQDRLVAVVNRWTSWFLEKQDRAHLRCMA
jgi:hypothetical protein